MQTLAFIDLEVNPETRKVLDFGAANAGGETLHTTQNIDFENFIADCNYICGHNVCHHDANYFNRPKESHLIDTIKANDFLPITRVLSV